MGWLQRMVMLPMSVGCETPYRACVSRMEPTGMAFEPDVLRLDFFFFGSRVALWPMSIRTWKRLKVLTTS